MDENVSASNEKILTSIKKLLGIYEDNTDFDTDILIHINSIVTILNQLGVGPDEGFTVDENSTWSEYINDDSKLNSVKSYIYLKVKMIFDPPMSSAIRDANVQMIDELEWRLNLYHESDKEEV
jgi:hypothetical protein